MVLTFHFGEMTFSFLNGSVVEVDEAGTSTVEYEGGRALVRPGWDVVTESEPSIALD